MPDKTPNVLSPERAAFLTEHQPNWRQALSYSPLKAEGLALLSAEVAELSTEQRASLERNGFVICRDTSYSNFVEGYAALFKADLPVFISADSLLHALHWSFSGLLTALE